MDRSPSGRIFLKCSSGFQLRFPVLYEGETKFCVLFKKVRTESAACSLCDTAVLKCILCIVSASYQHGV